jgi:SAM-dependent methyltransferase
MDSSINLPRAASITHEHLLACVNTALDERAADAAAPFRILDAGCGDGRLLAYLAKCLAQLQPARKIELYGFDVLDHGVQPQAFLERTVANLQQECPDVDWSQRVLAARSEDPWPFADGFCDMVVSNQVLEHVHAPQRFFSEHCRVLVRGGHGYHLFPLKHYIYEGHLLLPWVHRIRSWELMRGYIAWLSAMGLGKYREHARRTGVSRAEFAERHADYVYFWTHYLSEREVVQVARGSGLRACFRHTGEFYAAKLRSVCGLQRKRKYAARGSRALRDAVGVKFLRYLSSVTLAVEKQNAY